MQSPPASQLRHSVPSSMRAVVARAYGRSNVLEVDEVPVPTPASDELLISVAASSLNALDWHYVTGTPYLVRIGGGLRTPQRAIPGADVAGTVVAVGADVSRFKPGDEVFGECKGGGCSAYLVSSEDSVVAKPATVLFEAAAATPVAGLTAVQTLRAKAEVQPGEHVLINGAAGGVGTFSVQIAKALGAEVTAVCSTRNVEMVAALGADHVIDYTTTDFVTGGARFDVMMDNVGNRSPAECLSVLKPDGRFVAISGPKENRWLGPIGHMLRTRLAFWRASQTFHQLFASPNPGDLGYLAELLDSGELKPEIDKVVGYDGVRAAMDEIASGHARAKIVVVAEADTDVTGRG